MADEAREGGHADEPGIRLPEERGDVAERQVGRVLTSQKEAECMAGAPVARGVFLTALPEVARHVRRNLEPGCACLELIAQGRYPRGPEEDRVLEIAQPVASRVFQNLQLDVIGVLHALDGELI